MSLTNIKDESPYTAPKAELASASLHNLIENNAFYVVSRSKLVILSFCTLNLYLLFWFYRNWKLYRDNSDFSCIPILRAIFNLFFIHSLFTQVNDALQSKHLPDKASGLMATLYVISIVVSVVTNQWEPTTDQLAPFVLLFMVTLGLQLLPILYIQKRINLVCDDPQAEQNNRLSWFNGLLILPGILYWGSLFMSVFMTFLWL
ncbi:hypothetical protein Q4574_01925 [Aliiglaciecola sp. 3_MG-2023]|uniref:hypothetical protein n=1 Tax=Aliiglaciecola sp. 3_MG-2023 TaxID=3062644 RepID=UPI0026E314B3|nr:hypothetical protein [Aliiglaciecola sp. 3_MG-2023]MDO6692018.1 hypothetical protein [Aliiglaciecola sp. 3_MG-2023]